MGDFIHVCLPNLFDIKSNSKSTFESVGFDEILNQKEAIFFCDFNATLQENPKFYIANGENVDLSKCFSTQETITRDNPPNISELNEVMNYLGNNPQNKIVYSFSKNHENNDGLDCNKIFEKAKKDFPHCLFFHIESKIFGTWLGATPELVLKIENDKIYSQALAGTKHINEEWSKKEILEQEIVTKHLEESFESLNLDNIETQSLESENMGNIKHLKTNISANLNIKENNIIELIKKIYPSPAVCGYPKMESYNFLEEKEKHNRELYTGLIGYKKGKNWWVYSILRCAKAFSKNNIKIYAGAGMISTSDVQAEKIEIERKIKVIKTLFQ